MSSAARADTGTPLPKLGWLPQREGLRWAGGRPASDNGGVAAFGLTPNDCDCVGTKPLLGPPFLAPLVPPTAAELKLAAPSESPTLNGLEAVRLNCGDDDCAQPLLPALRRVSRAAGYCCCPHAAGSGGEGVTRGCEAATSRAIEPITEPVTSLTATAEPAMLSTLSS